MEPHSRCGSSQEVWYITAILRRRETRIGLCKSAFWVCNDELDTTTVTFGVDYFAPLTNHRSLRRSRICRWCTKASFSVWPAPDQNQSTRPKPKQCHHTDQHVSSYSCIVTKLYTATFRSDRCHGCCKSDKSKPRGNFCRSNCCQLSSSPD